MTAPRKIEFLSWSLTSRIPQGPCSLVRLVQWSVLSSLRLGYLRRGMLESSGKLICRHLLCYDDPVICLCSPTSPSSPQNHLCLSSISHFLFCTCAWSGVLVLLDSHTLYTSSISQLPHSTIFSIGIVFRDKEFMTFRDINSSSVTHLMPSATRSGQKL